MKSYVKLPIALSIGLLMGASATWATEVRFDCPQPPFDPIEGVAVAYLINHNTDEKATQYALKGNLPAPVSPDTLGKPLKMAGNILACKYQTVEGTVTLKSEEAHPHCTVSQYKDYFNCNETGNPKKMLKSKA